MSWRWYGVKTIYRTKAIGKPRHADARFDAEGTLIEERVVLFRARNFDEAIRKAGKEAHAYSTASYRNIYGQRVVQRYLGACDAYELFESPAASIEVFSSTEVVPGSVSNREVLNRRLGEEGRPKRTKRTKFFNAELLAAPASSVIRGPKVST